MLLNLCQLRGTQSRWVLVEQHKERDIDLVFLDDRSRDERRQHRLHERDDGSETRATHAEIADDLDKARFDPEVDVVDRADDVDVLLASLAGVRGIALYHSRTMSG